MHRHTTLLIMCLLLACITAGMGQSRLTEHTLKLDAPENAASASIADFEWLTGRWEGTGFGGIVEETWNPPLGGTMAGTFRLVQNDSPGFYEMLLLVPEGNSISYRVKHFNPDFTGWEDKEHYVNFPLVKITRNAAYFHGLTLERHGDKCIHYLSVEEKDGTHREVMLEYTRSDFPVSEESRSFLDMLPRTEPVPLLILGSYHMANPGADKFNLESDDVLTQNRQQEIQNVVDRLAEWNPTKIAIEAPFGDSATIARYESYLTGDHTLRRSEEEQIGFRLAKQLGHKTIYPIDVPMGMDFGALEMTVGKDPEKFGPYVQQLQTMGTTAIKRMSQWLSEGTIGSMLYNMNDPVLHELSHTIYFQTMVPVVEGDDYTGTDIVSSWYHRNLRIFSNLHQVTDRPDDRILIIYGQGHAQLLRDFAKDSPYFRLDEVQEYLRGL